MFADVNMVKSLCEGCAVLMVCHDMEICVGLYENCRYGAWRVR